MGKRAGEASVLDFVCRGGHAGANPGRGRSGPGERRNRARR